MPKKKLIVGEDYYIENGLYVFTEKYLKERGYCCSNGCRHCPYPKEENSKKKASNRTEKVS